MNGPLFKRIITYDSTPNHETRKGKKFTNLLRQTMDTQFSRAFRDPHLTDSTNSKEICIRQDDIKGSTNDYQAPLGTSKATTTKIDIFETSNREGEKLKERMESMQQQMEQLKKNKQKHNDLLYKVNQHKSPTYIDLDSHN